MRSERTSAAEEESPSAADEAGAEGGIGAARTPKYRVILEDLRGQMASGRLAAGDKLRTEAELGRHYGASRITVAKAVNELMREGLVSRRAGSGTHVLASVEARGHVFGLLIPDLGRTEIFEPICQGMMGSTLARPHSLLWGHAMGEAHQQDVEARQLSRHYIAQKVAGVFFAPLEFTPERDAVNRQIAASLAAAGIAMVLLDRCYAPYPSRSPHDLVGIDNRAAGYLITAHVLKLGARRPTFVSRAGAASTIQGRIGGYREALQAYGLGGLDDGVRTGDTGDRAFVRGLLEELRPDAVVCANDLGAGRLIQTLTELGVGVPEEMRVVGIDDVKYASLLPVPLTTQHQNCAEIGEMALATMLQRVAQPGLPVRDVLLQTRTVVRSSCGVGRSVT